MTRILNNRFNTNKPFIEAMVEETDETNLPDSVFVQACDEFGIEEEQAMELMCESSAYEFVRHESGWYIMSSYCED